MHSTPLKTECCENSIVVNFRLELKRTGNPAVKQKERMGARLASTAEESGGKIMTRGRDR